MGIQGNLSIGTKLYHGTYEIIGILGQGGFGITYLAQDVKLQKKYAIKEFFPQTLCGRDETLYNITDSSAVAHDLVTKLKTKFVKEAKFLASLSDPNIVSVHAQFEENNTAYYVMDYIEGETLSAIIDRKGKLGEQEALGYMAQICSAMKAVHARHINHLDIKPGNIIIRNSDRQAILIDFGTSKQYDGGGDETTTMTPSFTSGYAPMEQYVPGGVASFSPQTDIYAMGATLYAMLSGQKPPQYSYILENGLPPLPSSVSQSTRTAIKQAMNGKRTERPADIQAFERLLFGKAGGKATASKSSMLIPLSVCGVLGAAVGVFVQYFFAKDIYYSIDLPAWLLLWFVPALCGIIGLLAFTIYCFRKFSGGRGMACVCIGIFALSGCAGATVTKQAIPIKHVKSDSDSESESERRRVSIPETVTLSGELAFDHLPLLHDLPQVNTADPLTFTMNDDNILIQNGDGYVKAEYALTSTSDGQSGEMSVYNIEGVSYNGVQAQWIDAIQGRLDGIVAWQTFTDDNNQEFIIMLDSNGNTLLAI